MIQMHANGKCRRDCGECRRLRRAALEVAAAAGIAQVSADAVAEAAGLPAWAACAHGSGCASGWLASAYEEAAQALRSEFELGFAPARRWCDGMRWATEALVKALVADPACARYCFVEVPGADGELRVLDARARERWVALVEREYGLREPERPIPHARIRLACDTIAGAVAAHARSARLAELPAALDAVSVVAAGG
jgi:hypothetical protein